jgi:hypothetical protein
MAVPPPFTLKMVYSLPRYYTTLLYFHSVTINNFFPSGKGPSHCQLQVGHGNERPISSTPPPVRISQPTRTTTVLNNSNTSAAESYSNSSTQQRLPEVNKIKIKVQNISSVRLPASSQPSPTAPTVRMM